MFSFRPKKPKKKKKTELNEGHFIESWRYTKGETEGNQERFRLKLTNKKAVIFF